MFALLVLIAGASCIGFIYQVRYKNEFGDPWRDEIGAWPHLFGHLLRGVIFSVMAYYLWGYLSAARRLRDSGRPELDGLLRSLPRWWASLALGTILVLLYAIWTAYGDLHRSPVQPLSPRYRTDAGVDLPIRAEFRLAEKSPAEDLIETAIPGVPDHVFLHQEAALTNKDIASTRVVVGSDGRAAIDFTVAEASQQKMGDLTSANVGKYLVVVIDGQVVAGATIQSRIRQSGRINGYFTQLEAERIAKALTGKN